MPRLLEAPYLDWTTFEDDFASRWEQGQHVLFDGPSGSGKTVAARHLARRREYVVVLGTKMRDPEMDAYIAEGYIRVDRWPPPRRALRRGSDGSVRVVLWPKIKKREDLRRFSDEYAAAFDEALIDGGWTIVADEGLWLASRSGLDLSDQLDATAYTGRSAGVTLMLCVQRPRGIPINCWTNVSHAFLWHVGNTDDVRELASLGVTDRRAVQEEVQRLAAHDFLYLPCRAGAEWCVSAVDI